MGPAIIGADAAICIWAKLVQPVCFYVDERKNDIDTGTPGQGPAPDAGSGSTQAASKDLEDLLCAPPAGRAILSG